MATLYCNTSGSKPSYECSVSYGTVTRSGTTVTVPNVTLTLTRNGNDYTTNRIAYCAGKSSNGTDIANNTTINSYGTASRASYTKSLGNITYTTTGTSVHLYVAVASTGGSSSWSNFKGGSPVTVFNSDITCPAANPTFTTQPTASKKSETEIQLTSGSTNISSNMYYRYTSDRNSWPDWTNATLMSSSTITIGGLNANTTYYFQVQARNASDNSLRQHSDVVNATTYSYPTLVSWPNDITMDAATKTMVFSFNNPLSRGITFKASIGNYEVQSTTWSNEGILNLDCDSVYDEIPTATSGTINLWIGANGLITSTTKTVYAVESYAKPTVKTAGLVWSAVHPSGIATIFTDTSKMVQNKSYLKVSMSSLANIGTANKGASAISSASFTFGGYTAQALTTTATAYGDSSRVYNYAGNQVATISVTDSRGYTGTATITIPFIEYANPIAAISAKRNDGYGTAVTLSLSGTCSSLNNTNSITNLQYKIGSSGTWTAAVVSSGAATVSTTLASNSTQIYYCKATDAAGNISAEVSFEVGVGQPIAFIDTDKQGVGVNCFPTGKGIYSEEGYCNGDIFVKTVKHDNNTNSTKYARICDWEIASNASLNGSYKIQGFITLSQGYNSAAGQLRQITFAINASNGNQHSTYGYFKMMAKQFNDGGNAATKFYLVQTSARKMTLWMTIPTYCTAYTTLTYFNNNNTITVYTNCEDTEPDDTYTEIAYSNILDAYPIGSIYMSYDSTSPALIFGGNWTQIKGKYMYALANSPGTNALTGVGTGSTTLTAAQSGLPMHRHDMTHTHSFGASFFIRHGNTSGTATIASGANTTVYENSYGDTWSNGFSTSTYSHKPDKLEIDGTTGGSSATNTGWSNNGYAQDASQGHSHEIAYYAVYVWQRIAD